MTISNETTTINNSANTNPTTTGFITGITTSPQQSPCPCCGYCPHCGRGGYHPSPYNTPPYTYPYYPTPYWGPTVSCGSGGLSTTNISGPWNSYTTR